MIADALGEVACETVADAGALLSTAGRRSVVDVLGTSDATWRALNGGVVNASRKKLKLTLLVRST